MSEDVAAHLASRHRMLEDQFTRWVKESPRRDGIADFAGRLLERFSEDTLRDLLAFAGGMPREQAHGWVRQQFDAAVGAFAVSLRNCMPRHVRHEAAQVLQLRLLEAERRLCDGLERWSRSG